MQIAPVLPSAGVAGRVAVRTALLINPFYAKDPRHSFGKHVLTPTLALTSIAAATPAGWEVGVWDENLLQGLPPGADGGAMPEVVGISVHLTFARRAYELARWYRGRGAKVVLGGLHVISCPEEAAGHADAICVGDGVQAWPRILEDVAAGRKEKVYRAAFTRPYREDPRPRRELVDGRDFLTKASLMATRGCSNRCRFCYLSTGGLAMPYQTREPADVAAEFAGLDEPYGVFTDNNLAANPRYLRELCAALRPLDKIWSAAITLDLTDRPEVIREMALAGCTGVFIGFETLSDANLADARKKTPRTADYARRVRLLHDMGIQVNGSFVLGFDHDRQDVFDRLSEWIESNRLESATFHILTPYPGTPLFEQMEREGRLLHKNWDLYDTGHVVFRPRHMSAEELEAGYAGMYRRLFSLGSIWRRRPERGASVGPFLAMALLYKKSNWLWPFLIRHRLTHRFWWPLLEVSRRRHLRFRRRLGGAVGESAVGVPVPAGV